MSGSRKRTLYPLVGGANPAYNSCIIDSGTEVHQGILPECYSHLQEGRGSSESDLTVLRMRPLQISAVVFSFISLLLLLISLGSDYWVEFGDVHQGLWNICQLSTCLRIESGNDKLNAIRAFMLLGMIAGAVSFFGLCATFFRSTLGSYSLTKILAIVSFIAGLCTMIAMSISTDEAERHFSWSFGLGWATFPLYLITGRHAYASQATASE